MPPARCRRRPGILCSARSTVTESLMDHSFIRWPHTAALFVFVTLLALPGPAKAGFTLVTDPSQVGSNAAVNWGSLGPAGTQFTSPITVSSGGSNLTITADSFVPGVGFNQ